MRACAVKFLLLDSGHEEFKKTNLLNVADQLQFLLDQLWMSLLIFQNILEYLSSQDSDEILMQMREVFPTPLGLLVVVINMN